MSETVGTPSEREEIEMLLPWFVTGRLDRADMERVEAYLSRYPAMRRQVELAREEQRQSASGNEAIRPPRLIGADEIIARAGGARAAAHGMLGRIRTFFDAPTAGTVRFAAAAACALILVQAAALGVLLAGRSGGGTSYETASGGPQHSGDGALAIVRFTDTASARSISAALSALRMTIVDGPKPGGLYTVRIGGRDLGEAERERRMAALRDRADVVALVTPVR